MKPIEKTYLANYQQQEIYSYTLTNNQGVQLSVMNYGATLLAYRVWDKDNQLRNIVLRYEKFENYPQNKPKLGASIGPVAGRLAGGRVELDGKLYQLAQNNLGNHLHGGHDGFADTIFQVAEVNDDSVVFQTERADDTGNYPGNVAVKITYRLTELGECQITYQATTDKPTLFNPTNHAYFHLGQSDTPIDEMSIQLNAASYAVLKSDNIPTGELNTEAPFLRLMQEGTTFAQLFAQQDEQLKERNGLDHAFVLDNSTVALTLSHEKTGVHLQVKTEAPAVVLYTANSYDADEPSISGVKPFAHNGVAIETQILPDAINHDNFGNIVLSPNETFMSTTTYRAFVE